MPSRTPRPSRQRAVAAAVALAVAGALAPVAPAEATTPASPTKPGEPTVAGHAAVANTAAQVRLGPLTSAAVAHPMPGLTLSAFGSVPTIVATVERAQQAQAAKARAAALAKQRAAKKRAAQKKAARAKAAAARSAASRASRGGARASGSPRDIARAMVADRGWGSEQFSCLDKLWTKESDWLVTADNPTSSAYGIPQALPGRKMAKAGSDWRTNPATQIRWGLGYIADRYGKPCAAWSHSKANNWY